MSLVFSLQNKVRNEWCIQRSKNLNSRGKLRMKLRNNRQRKSRRSQNISTIEVQILIKSLWLWNSSFLFLENKQYNTKSGYFNRQIIFYLSTHKYWLNGVPFAFTLSNKYKYKVLRELYGKYVYNFSSYIIRFWAFRLHRCRVVNMSKYFAMIQNIFLKLFFILCAIGKHIPICLQFL